MEGDVTRIKNIANSKEMFGYETREQVAKSQAAYEKLYAEETNQSISDRKKEYRSMVTDFYNLVTEFYEFGWGQSFHFAPRHGHESFETSIARQEFYLALRLGLAEGIKCVDLGCGIGGPMRSIARFSRAHVTGVNVNDFQIKRAKQLTKEQNLDSLCSLAKGDFMNLPFEPNTFDAGYQIEAFCHAPDKTKVYAEAFRILKPGAKFAGYQWCVTAKFDPNNSKHKEIRWGIEKGNGVPILESFQTELDAVKAAGFKILSAYDKAPEAEVPWYNSLDAKYSIIGFKHTPLGRRLTHWMVKILETVRIAPAGSVKVHEMLCKTADDLVEGGRLGIFTPMFFILAEKPKSS